MYAVAKKLNALIIWNSFFLLCHEHYIISNWMQRQANAQKVKNKKWLWQKEIIYYIYEIPRLLTACYGVVTASRLHCANYEKFMRVHVFDPSIPPSLGSKDNMQPHWATLVDLFYDQFTLN